MKLTFRIRRNTMCCQCFHTRAVSYIWVMLGCTPLVMPWQGTTGCKGNRSDLTVQYILTTEFSSKIEKKIKIRSKKPAIINLA